MLDLVDDLYQQGLKLHKSGKIELACQVYTLVLDANPEHSMANHNMGALAVDIGKVQEALPFFEAALEANADVAQFWVSYIDALINVERIADAQAVFHQAKNNGAKGDGFDKLEQRLKDAGQEPLEANQIASEPQPKLPNILDGLKLDQAIKLAKKKAKAGSTEESKSIYEDILVKFPKNKRAIDGLKVLAGKSVGIASKAEDAPKEELQSLMTLYNNGQLALVVEQAQTLTKQYPRAFAIWNLMGASAAQIGQLDQAIVAFKRVLAIKPDYADAYNNMGNVLKEQGKLEEARIAYEKAISLNGNFTEAFSNLSTVLEKTGNFEEALNVVSCAIALSPNNAQAQNNKGVILQAMQRYDEAKLAFEKAIQLDQVFADAIYNIGELHLEEGNWQEASVQYKRVLEIQPGSAAALYGLGTCYMKLGKKDLALINFAKSKVLDTENILGNDLQLALMNKRDVPSKTPENYLKNFYRKKSKTWGKDKVISYQGHAIIEDALKTVNFTKPLNILDLGCGTGSLGKFLKPFSNSLVGVDISPDMLSKANYDGSYDCLHLNEIESFLSKNLDTYDLIVAAAVLIHFLSLEDIFSLVNKNLNDKGSFVFSIFENKITDKSINDFLMYSHNSNYVEMVSANTGFRIVYSKKAVHEYHGKEENPVFAWTYVLTKDHKKNST